MSTHNVGRFEAEGVGNLVRTLAGLGLITSYSFGSMRPPATRRTASAVRKLLRLDERIEGLEQVQKDTAYVVTPLHEGFADPLLLARLPLDLRYVARDELHDWPLLGRILRRTGQISVSPESRISGHRHVLAQVGDALRQGRSVVMFPQGSILGVEAGFHRGPFRIADKLGVPVLPVVITGTHRVWEHPYTNRIRFGEPVYMQVLAPVDAGTAEGSMRSVQARMKEIALANEFAPVRHFDPEVDGFWDEYRYEIDPAFSEVRDKVRLHRGQT